MRLLLALLFISAVATADLTDSDMLESGSESGSGEEIEVTTMEVTTTTKDPVRKWNHQDLLSPYESKATPCDEVIEVVEDAPCSPCPHGWYQYKESCYLIKKKLANMETADKICQDYETTLFVADEQQELDHIMSLTIPGKTWIGIFKKDEEMTSWQAGCGMEVEKLPWLVKDYELHGWNEHSRCAALNSKDGVNYTHYYPCERPMNFICERNATLYV